jgi:hypothetical protein
MTISAGSVGTMKVTVTPQAGSFNNAVALACSGLPSDLSCSFSPASITPGASAISSTLTVKAASVIAGGRQRRNFVFATGLFSLGLFGITLIGRIRTRSLLTALGSIMILGSLVLAMSCGGNSLNAVNAASSVKTYAVTIHGAAGSVQVATTVAVTVE